MQIGIIGLPNSSKTTIFNARTDRDRRVLVRQIGNPRRDGRRARPARVPAIRRIGNTHLVNPGSLGQPRHGLPSATFAVWEDGSLQIHHIDYDPKPTMNKLALMSLDPEIEARLREILERGM